MHVVDEKANDKSAQVALAYDFDGTDPGYPFLLSVKLTYTLDTDGFTLHIAAENRARTGPALPLSASWHSYFAVSDISRSLLQLDSCSKWNHIDVHNSSSTESDLIPTGTTTPFQGFDGTKPIGGGKDAPTYWDDEFKALQDVETCSKLKVRVHDPSIGQTSVLWMDSNFRWVQIFTGTAKNFREQGIAVEAMTSQADSWNNEQGILLLQAGQSWGGSLGVYLEKTDSRSSIHL